MFSMNSLEIFLNLWSIALYFVVRPVGETKTSFKLHGPISEGISSAHLVYKKCICWLEHASSMARAGCLSLGYDFNQELKALVKKQSCQNGIV